MPRKKQHYVDNSKLLEVMSEYREQYLIAKDNDIEIKERLITRDELYTADEIFLCGTAVEIAPVKSVDKTSIGNGSRGKVTNLIQSTYFDCVKGKIEKYNSWLSRV